MYHTVTTMQTARKGHQPRTLYCSSITCHFSTISRKSTHLNNTQVCTSRAIKISIFRERPPHSDHAAPPERDDCVYLPSVYIEPSPSTCFVTGWSHGFL